VHSSGPLLRRVLRFAAASIARSGLRGTASFLMIGVVALPVLPGCGRLRSLLHDGGVEGEGDAGDGAADGEGGGPAEGEGEGGGGWVALSPYPCGVNRTDALHVDDDGTLWTGCGSNTEGTGLYVSRDGGRTWGSFAAAGAARSFFDAFRVLSISRSSDGALYIGGAGTSGARVVRVDDAGEVTAVVTAGAGAGTGFTVGHFRRDGAGRAIAESLTGTDVLVRARDDEPFVAAGATLFDDGRTHQILDLTLDGDTFHAVGSTIAEPNLYFREVPAPVGQPLAFAVVDLSGTGAAAFDGELRGVAASGGTVVVGGVAEDADDAVFYVIDDDAVDLFFAADVRPTLRAATVRGVCAAPGHFVVVGAELQNDGTAFVFHSTDGVAWQDLTDGLPTNPGSLNRCVVREDRVFVAGAGGSVLRYDF
jgi:hypothetical protein